MIYIYTLSHPETGEVRYVGKTNGGQCRVKTHVAEANRGVRTHKANWIRQLLREDLRPTLDIIDEYDGNDWAWLEKYWIEQFKAWDFRLTNTSVGGENPPVLTGHTEETKSKMSKIKIEYFKNNEHHRVGSKLTKEHVELLRKQATGKSHSAETRAKISEGKKGHTDTPTKRIANIDDNGNIIKEYSGIREAERSLGLYYGAIWQRLQPKKRKKNSWIYLD